MILLLTARDTIANLLFREDVDKQRKILETIQGPDAPDLGMTPDFGDNVLETSANSKPGAGDIVNADEEDAPNSGDTKNSGIDILEVSANSEPVDGEVVNIDEAPKPHKSDSDSDEKTTKNDCLESNEDENDEIVDVEDATESKYINSKLQEHIEVAHLPH